MATFANALQKILQKITSNNNREVTAANHREVETEIVQAISENVGELQIPVMNGGKHMGYATLKFDPVTGELQLSEFKLGRGVIRVNEIYNSGVFSGNPAKTLVTKRYVDSLRRVIGTISTNLDIVNQLRVGDVVTLDGDVSHTIVEGDTFLLKSQTDPAENIPYTVGAESAAAADWYDATKNQEIIIEKGPATKASMPAVEEGGDPVVEIQMQSGELVIAVADWVGNTVDVATGDLKITADSRILIGPKTKSDETLSTSAEIFCTDQGINTLTFSCVTVPTADITINMIVLW